MPAELECEGFQSRGGPGCDLLGDAARPGKRDLCDQRVGAERLAEHGSISGNAGDDTRWNTGLFGQIHQHPGGKGRLLRGFDDNRAPGREGRRELPDDKRHRKVPGCDRRDHADRRGSDVAAGCEARSRKLGDPDALCLSREVLDDLDRTRDLGLGLRQGLTLFTVDDLCEDAGLLGE